MTAESTARKRGRPRRAGSLQCDRCQRQCNKIAVHWPDGAICGICFYDATHSHGRCPGCGVDRMLPGRDPMGAPACVECTGIRQRFTCATCATCGQERPRFRTSTCIECALRNDISVLPAEKTIENCQFNKTLNRRSHPAAMRGERLLPDRGQHRTPIGVRLVATHRSAYQCGNL